MQVTIERFDPARHDAATVARLVYQADPSLMRFVFGEEDEAVPVLARLVEMDHNEYSGRYVRCAVTGSGEVVGVAAGLTGAERRASAKESGKEWGRALGARGMLRAMRWGPRLESVATTEVGDDELYLSALTVDERFRGHGVGSALLASVLDEHPVVVTDVNITKDDALRFYRRHGFEVEREMTFVHKGDALGNFQIRRDARRAGAGAG